MSLSQFVQNCANLFKLRDSLPVVRKLLFNLGFELMFEGGPDVQVLPFLVYSMVICTVLLSFLAFKKELFAEHFIMFFARSIFVSSRQNSMECSDALAQCSMQSSAQKLFADSQSVLIKRVRQFSARPRHHTLQ